MTHDERSHGGSGGPALARVVHVAEAFGGGVAAAVRDYARALPECEHHLICRLRPEATTLEATWVDEFASIEVIEGGHAGAVAAVRRRVRLLRPDAVHSHSSFAGVWARTATLGMSGIRSVYTPHAWAFDRQDKSPAQRRAYELAERSLLRRTDVLAGCSLAENQVARRWRADVQTVYVPNVAPEPVPGLAGAAIEEADPAQGLLLAGSGRLTLQKDPLWFRDAVRALRASGRTVRAVWIGGGDAELERALRAEQIEVTGWVGSTAARQRLAQADLYLHSARWEGFPITVLEAAALNRPMILRGISAFDGVELPMVVSSPADVAGAWGRLESAQARRELVAAQAEALWENTTQVQRERLAEAYGVQVPSLSPDAAALGSLAL